MSTIITLHTTPRAQLERSLDALNAHPEAFDHVPGLLNISPFIDLRPNTNAVGGIQLIVDPDQQTPTDAWPQALDGLPVYRRVATAQELTEGFIPLSVWAGTLSEADEDPRIGYKPPDPGVVALLEREVHHITCHVGPDSGWPLLKSFLEGTQRSLTVAMYEFNALHILDTFATLGQKPDLNLSMILEVSSADNNTEQQLRVNWKDRLTFVPAVVDGPHRVFATSYHTKVAVRDSSAFWLSSGNWNRTSQPTIPPGSEPTLYNLGNREWHLIIQDIPLAGMYEKFIQYDMQQAAAAAQPEAAPLRPDLLVPATAFIAEAAVVQPHPFKARTFAATGAPIRVKPLMSPDNYAREVLKLIQGAERTLYLQFSYIRQPSLKVFNDIITAISEKMQAGLDVRVLVSQNQEPDHSKSLVASRGWNPQQFRQQKGKMHNKGILIDGRVAVVGSNNWSTFGTQFNRDTSLVLFSPAIHDYYKEVFLFDWDNLSVPVGQAPETAPLLAPADGSTPPGMVRVRWEEWFN